MPDLSGIYGEKGDCVMGLFDLPRLWAYVWYEDGTRESVANTDTLTRREAERFRDQLQKLRGKTVVRVTLEDRKGSQFEKYKFT